MTGHMASTDIEPGALALFVEFVRVNPTVEPDHPVIPRVFSAYVEAYRRSQDSYDRMLKAEP